MTQLDAREVLSALAGTVVETPGSSKRWEIVGVGGSDVRIRPVGSLDGATTAPLEDLQAALVRLFESGRAVVTHREFADQWRDGLLAAVLVTVPTVKLATTSEGVEARLAGNSPLAEQLRRAFALVRQSRTADRVVANDPLYRIVVKDLKATISATVDSPGYKVLGSVGQPNFTWATTPWVAVFDRLVTESARRGHYVVLLIDHDGSGAYLSLSQGVTESAGARHVERLAEGASGLRGLLPFEAIANLYVDPLDLSGGGWRTRSYNAANIAAVRLESEALAHDAWTVFQLRRLLRLGDTITARMDEKVAAYDLDRPDEAHMGLESRRYRWHLRAEGRNQGLARRVKQLHGYVCCVCDRDFVDEFGARGRRLVDAHHLTPFSELDGRPTQLDPRTDFAVVCANCHRLIHSETPPLSPGQARSALRRS